MSVYFIAEAGVNHNGSVDLALKLVDIAARAGANAVKFQTFKAESLVLRGAPKAEYQQKQTGNAEDQFSMIKALELSKEDHKHIHTRCEQLGIEFLSTPFDVESVDFLITLGMRRIKIPSGELTNKPFIENLAARRLPLLLSTGMADLDEVAETIRWIIAARSDCHIETPLAEDLAILHCTSNYPADFSDINLRAIQTLSDEFGLPVGYSDHSAGILIAPVAVACGATIIEKHFTLDRSLPGPDHQASLEPSELTQLIQNIRAIEQSLGDGIKNPRPRELPVRALVRRSVTSVYDLPIDHVVQADDVALLRPGTGIPPKDLHAVIGKRSARRIPAGTTLTWEDFV